MFRFFGFRSPGSIRFSVFLLLALGLSQASGRSWEDVQADGTLSVAVYQDFPPYAFMLDDKAMGVDVDVAQALADGLGLKLRLHWMIADKTLGMTCVIMFGKVIIWRE